MKLWNLIARLATTVAVALAGAAASAGPVTMTLQGTVTGYEFIDLSTVGIANGSAVNLTLHFNETWSDGSYSFADPLGPVSGSMTVGAYSFDFDNGNPFSYSYDGNTGAVLSVRPQFTGTGPVLGGGDFFGLFATFNPDMTLAGDLLLGYGFTTVYPDVTVINYGYSRITATSYSITPDDGNPVPTPATLPLVLTALCAIGLVRRRT